MEKSWKNDGTKTKESEAQKEHTKYIHTMLHIPCSYYIVTQYLNNHDNLSKRFKYCCDNYTKHKYQTGIKKTSRKFIAKCKCSFRIVYQIWFIIYFVFLRFMFSHLDLINFHLFSLNHQFPTKKNYCIIKNDLW